MNKKNSRYYVLLVLVLMFAAPGIAAYIVYQHPNWLGNAKINKGTLLNPPVLLNALKGQNQWRIVYWTPDACEQSCLKQLDVLARVHLALGRKLYQVDQWLILSKQETSLSPEVTAQLKELNFKLGHLSQVEMNQSMTLFSDAKIFLADPNNYLILSYPEQVNPDDIYKDLKLLLNTTEKNNG